MFNLQICRTLLSSLENNNSSLIFSLAQERSEARIPFILSQIAYSYSIHPAKDNILIMRTSVLLLLLVVSQVDTCHGFAFSSRQPTAASRMNTATMQLVNNDDANMESETSSSSSSRPSRRDMFRGSLLAGAAAMMIPFENAEAIELFSGKKSRIGGLADKIRGILKNMVRWSRCGCHMKMSSKGLF
jgi:hypothetical protein